MQDGVLHAADILIDRHPIVGSSPLERTLAALWAAEAHVVPGRVDEGVERIGLAPRGLAAARAGHVLPGRMVLQRIARPVEGDVVWKRDRQRLLWHRNDTAAIAVDHRNRTAPIALA